MALNLLGGVLTLKDVAIFMFSILMISALGYALGRITVKGVNLGTSGVFIVALLFGALCYNQLTPYVYSSPEAAKDVTKLCFKVIENFGLILFVTAVGFIAGPKFFANFKKNFKSYVLLAVVIIFVGGLVAIGCVFFGSKLGIVDDIKELSAMVSGLFSGALTSTPAFSAAKAAAGKELEDFVSVGYGIAYIFGVVGVVLFVQLIPKLVRADMDKERELARAVDTGKKKEYKGKIFKLDNFSFLPFFFAAAIGILIGAIKIPLSGEGLSGTCFSLTSTGGCLITAIVFGHFGHIGRINIIPTEQTLKVFRELGLMLFLIGAGVPSGSKFVECFKVSYFFFGVVMNLIPMIAGFFFAKYVLKLSLLNNLGSITGGMTSTPALGTLIHVAKTEDVASAYAATYPVALIAVVLVSQLIITLFS